MFYIFYHKFVTNGIKYVEENLILIFIVTYIME